MPLIESRPDAAANLYARALFDVAQAQGGRAAVEDVQGELEAILGLARQDKAFGEFLASRAIAASARAASLERIFKGRIRPVLLNFLQVLNRKRRIAELPAIAEAFDTLAQEAFGRVEVDLFTAAPASADGLRSIRDELQKVLGRDAIVHPYVDAAMIGGVKLRIGDQLVDGSVSTQLRRFREQLAGKGAAEVRARTDRILTDRA